MAKHVSEVEDGFALNRQRENAKRGKKRKVKGECTIPPPPVKHILSSYTMSNPISKRAISDYVETQARDEKVQHTERIMSEHVVGNDYDCWDVHTNKDRYWVITNPTNLYSQHYFPSLDYTLSFHIGVMLRVMALQRGAPSSGHKSRFTAICDDGSRRLNPTTRQKKLRFPSRGHEMPGNSDPIRQSVT